MTCAWVCWALVSAKPPVPHARSSTRCAAARSASLTKCGSQTSRSSGRKRVSNSIGSYVAGCVQYSCMRTSLSRSSKPNDFRTPLHASTPGDESVTPSSFCLRLRRTHIALLDLGLPFDKLQIEHEEGLQH